MTSNGARLFRTPPQVTEELARILAIPRRNPNYPEDEQSQLVREMTSMLRRPGGTETLRPIQAIALFEMAYRKGAYMPIRVSGGKTLCSLLAPTVLESKRPLLIVPAKLVEKTRRAWREKTYHWRIYDGIYIVSYEWLSRVQAAAFLDTYKPDALILDESHKIKASKSAAKQRIEHYLDEHPGVPFVAMTGTGTKRSIKDYAHCVAWAIRGPECPLPLSWSDLESWSFALDQDLRPGAEPDDDRDPGALVALCAEGETPRDGFRRRMTETFGIVSTKESAIDCPIVVSRFSPRPPVEVTDAVALMRKTWETPDEEGFAEATTMWRHCREMASGFWYKWDPAPPKPWRRARKEWAAECRSVLTYNRSRIVTEMQLCQAIDRGAFPESRPLLRAWRDVRDTFRPNTVPVWISDYLIDAIAADVGRPGRATHYWTESVAFAERLREKTGLPYYGPEARDSKTRRSLLDHPHDEPAILSWHSCREGFDLEYCSRAFFTFAPTNGAGFEQALGRHHRSGQKSDDVEIVIVDVCDEHKNALDTLINDARYIQETTGQEQKALLADWT